MQAKDVVDFVGKFFVKAQVGTVGAVVVLKKADYVGTGEEVAHKKAVAPAGVHDDNVRL